MKQWFLKGQTVIPESGSELRSAHRTMGMEDGSEVGEPVATEPEALSAMLFSSDRNIMVWINLTSEYSGSQCMCALATRISCLSCGGFMPESRGKNCIRCGANEEMKRKNSTATVK